jgi:hydroxymethylbilane synthase
VPFTAIGTKGMFVKEIEEALLNDAIDLAVHSLKDMPGALPDGLILAAVPTRADARDALLSDGRTLEGLPPGARVGTSSLRRQALLRSLRPDLALEELRGNLDTRLRKLDDGHYDAIVLACAGLERLGWTHRIVERLPPNVFVPPPGQGALALETRADDADMRALLSAIHDPDTADCVAAERAFQAALNAGCTIPAGAYARLEGDALHLSAFVASADGLRLRRTETQGYRHDAVPIGARAASTLLSADNTKRR